MANETFFQLTKVDPFTGIAEGCCAAEEPDRDGEVLDYASSKPFFQQWSNSIAKDSKGKSFGNIRFQHDANRPVGRLIEPLQFDDRAKKIYCKAKIEEEEARRLLASGVLTGFSIGGAYKSRFPTANGLMRYIAGPIAEISVCDRPCAPSATYTLVKSDGGEQPKKFAPWSAQRTLMEASQERVDKARVLKFLQMGMGISDMASVLGKTQGEVQRLLRVLKSEQGESSYDRSWKKDAVEKGDSVARPARKRPNQAIMEETPEEAQTRIAEVVSNVLPEALEAVSKKAAEIKARKVNPRPAYKNFWTRQLEAAVKRAE